MESRMEKYYRNDVSDYSRSKKNTDLYKEVYGSYNDFEYLPVSNNTSEIDMNDLENIVSSREQYQKAKATCEFTNSSIKLKNEDSEEEKVIERKVYDINELIEKARNENAKAKEMMKDNKTHNFLETLEVSEESINRIKEMKNMTTEIDTTTIKETSVSVSENSTKADLPLEILSDLKPLGNTVVMEPMKEEGKTITGDIPIDSTFVKKGTKDLKKEMEESKVAFYSGSYTFSKKDFFDEDSDEEYEIKNNHKFLKVMLFIIGLSLISAIIYFCIVYFGMGNA